MRPGTFRRRASTVLVALVASGCADAADRAAKARIFSPEEPALEVRRAQEKLDVAAAATNAETWQRIFRMDAREAAQRLGSYTARADVTSRWTTGGTSTAPQAEKTTLVALTEGPFHLTLEIDPDSGLEFVWVGGQAFARSRFGPFRARRVDRAQHDAWRDQGLGAVRALHQLFDGRLKGSVVGTADVAGRRAVKFALLLDDGAADKPVAGVLPPTFGKVRRANAETGESTLVDGPDLDTTRRLAFDRLRVPKSVQGELLVDEASAVIVGLTATAAFDIPASSGDPAAKLVLDVKHSVRATPTAQVAAPKDVVTPKMPHVVKDPLGFHPVLGQKSAPGAASTSEDRPDDDDGDDDAPPGPGK